ncbi:hotdog fold thioesterase [Sediminibacterium goheungense]|uniref:1,4-dihydroxy-2-naphthoyl-CoA hydrolase n=1 Tax=Sediminibacterium goheungense TaxID=1086393 RepID=A0A4R6IN51_9BACT|nr:hotdog fold thioesterase [Sediminibacterium goheungense]TDO23622.1 1,4-dihydroxy-2-naphthoyl-CoA hydrolase [Sediminibacterium goheungense]
MSSIWFQKTLKVADIQPLGKNTMGEHLGMVFTELGDDYLKATMPVDHRTKQPYGLLHGGASVALAETLGSVGAALTIDPLKAICVGQEINANHLRGVREGLVTGIAKPVHIGASSQVWEIKIYDGREKLVCISRLTVAVLKNRS